MTQVSSVYAASLFSLAQDENKTDALLKELKEVCSLFNENKDYSAILDSPVIPLKERHGLIDEAFRDADEYVINFIKILCAKKKAHTFPECVKQYENLYNKANNIEKVTVVTAVELSNTAKEKLVKKLEDVYSKNILPEYRIDKGILGGIIIRTENSQTDASVRSRLEALKAHICDN